jgi:hypothetical protein
MKILIDLTEEKNDALKRACARLGITRAEGIRRSVDHWLLSETPVSAQEGIAGMFGVLASRWEKPVAKKPIAKPSVEGLREGALRAARMAVDATAAGAPVMASPMVTRGPIEMPVAREPRVPEMVEPPVIANEMTVPASATEEAGASAAPLSPEEPAEIEEAIGVVSPVLEPEVARRTPAVETERAKAEAVPSSAANSVEDRLREEWDRFVTELL